MPKTAGELEYKLLQKLPPEKVRLYLDLSAQALLPPGTPGALDGIADKVEEAARALESEMRQLSIAPDPLRISGYLVRQASMRVKQLEAEADRGNRSSAQLLGAYYQLLRNALTDGSLWPVRK